MFCWLQNALRWLIFCNILKTLSWFSVFLFSSHHGDEVSSWGWWCWLGAGYPRKDEEQCQLGWHYTWIQGCMQRYRLCSRLLVCGSCMCAVEKGTDVFLFFSSLVLILYSCRVEPWRVASWQTVSGSKMLFADSHFKGSVRSICQKKPFSTDMSQPACWKDWFQGCQ